MSNPSRMLIIQAVWKEYQAAQEELTRIRCSAAGAEASWVKSRELAGFALNDETIRYDRTEHERVTIGYRQSIEAQQRKLEEWEKALFAAINDALGGRV